MIPDLTVSVDIHVTPRTRFDVSWWDTTGSDAEPCPWRAVLHLTHADRIRKDVTIYLDPADLVRLHKSLGDTLVPCLTADCRERRDQHDRQGCTLCPCDEFRDEPPSAGADPWGRTADDMARSTE